MKSFEIGPRNTRVFFLHGLRGHGLAQHAALQHMVRNLGISMTSLEMEGHGEESKVRHCLVPHYKEIIANICASVKRHTIDAEQVILMGYSFGASLMILAAKELEQDPEFEPEVGGVIGISAAFSVAHNVPRWQLSLSKAIGPVSRFLFERSSRFSPLLTIHEMDVDRISRDVTVVKAIKEDPLIYKGRIPLATSAQVYQAGLDAYHSLKSQSLPALLLHSKDDNIALPPQPGEFGEHVQLRLFEKLRHNCIDGVSREVVAARKSMMQFIVDKL